MHLRIDSGCGGDSIKRSDVLDELKIAKRELTTMSPIFDGPRHRETVVTDTAADLSARILGKALKEGRIPRVPIEVRPESHILAGTDRQSGAREHFKYIEHRLRGMRHAGPIKLVLVTSSAPREGKTVVATNLATTLAFGSSRVLMI